MRVGVIRYHGDNCRMFCGVVPSSCELVVHDMSQPLDALAAVDVVINHYDHAYNKQTKCPYIAAPYGTIEQEHVAVWNTDPKCVGVLDVSSSLHKRFALRKPSFCFTPFYPCLPTYTEAGTGVISLINDYAQRFPEDHAFASTITKHIYGTPNPPVNDVEKLKDARWLLHIKSQGFVCNAVMKALACGVPVILDEASWRNGFLTEIIRHEHNGIVLPRDQIAGFLATCGADRYDRIKRICVAEANNYKRVPAPCQSMRSWLRRSRFPLRQIFGLCERLNPRHQP